nr:hypothetical protein [Tanacetum cinerariifolium]
MWHIRAFVGNVRDNKYNEVLRMFMCHRQNLTGILVNVAPRECSVINSQCVIVTMKVDTGCEWVKFHDIPITVFTEDGLSAIATKLSKPMMYARVMVKLRADVELKNTTVVIVPKFVGEGYSMRTICVEYEWTPPMFKLQDVAKNLKNPRQAVRGVQIGPNVGLKLAKQVYQHVSKKNNATTSSKKKQFDCLDKRGSIMAWFLLLMGLHPRHLLIRVIDDGKPINKVDPVNSDSDNEFEVAYDKTAQFMASVGANDANLYEEEDYDIYDIEGLSKQELAFCDRMDINLRGRSKDSLCLVSLRVKCKLVSMWSFPLI